MKKSQGCKQKILGLDVIGTLGLLLKAKRKGMVPSIKPLIIKMLEKGIWIKDEIVRGILKEAKEEDEATVRDNMELW